MRERTAKDGTVTYQVRFRHGGRQRSKSFETAEAARHFDDLIRVLGIERALIELDGHADNGKTLDECAQAYWQFLDGRVQERTVDDYRRDYRNWIAEPMGWMPAEQIDEERVQAWVESMRTKLSPKSVACRHAILHSIFKFASSPTRKLIAPGHNPCIGSDLPKRVKRMPRGLQPAEWQALIRALDQIDTDAADLAEFLVASGWRWSEATALTTFDVDDYGPDRGMWVNMSQVARRDSKGRVYVEQGAKSDAGMRRIGLDAEIAATVRRRMDGLAPGSFVFTTGRGAMWNYAHYRTRYWLPAVKVANLTRKPTIHQLRHTAVGYMDAAGADLAKIQKRIGHESIKTTIDVYGSMIRDVTPESLETLATIRGKRITRRGQAILDAGSAALPDAGTPSGP